MNQKTDYYAISNNFASALKRRNAKITFSLKCCISALPEFKQQFDLFNLFDSRLILTMLYDSLNIVINAFSPQGCWGHGSGERKSRALQQLDCVAHTVHCLLFPISQDNAKPLQRSGGTTKHRLLSYFLSNTCAKIIVIGLCMSRL